VVEDGVSQGIDCTLLELRIWNAGWPGLGSSELPVGRGSTAGSRLPAVLTCQ